MSASRCSCPVRQRRGLSGRWHNRHRGRWRQSPCRTALCSRQNGSAHRGSRPDGSTRRPACASSACRWCLSVGLPVRRRHPGPRRSALSASAGSCRCSGHSRHSAMCSCTTTAGSGSGSSRRRRACRPCTAPRRAGSWHRQWSWARRSSSQLFHTVPHLPGCCRCCTALCRGSAVHAGRPARGRRCAAGSVPADVWLPCSCWSSNTVRSVSPGPRSCVCSWDISSGSSRKP